MPTFYRVHFTLPDSSHPRFSNNVHSDDIYAKSNRRRFLLAPRVMHTNLCGCVLWPQRYDIVHVAQCNIVTLSNRRRAAVTKTVGYVGNRRSMHPRGAFEEGLARIALPTCVVHFGWHALLPVRNWRTTRGGALREEEPRGSLPC